MPCEYGGSSVRAQKRCFLSKHWLTMEMQVMEHVDRPTVTHTHTQTHKWAKPNAKGTSSLLQEPTVETPRP